MKPLLVLSINNKIKTNKLVKLKSTYYIPAYRSTYGLDWNNLGELVERYKKNPQKITVEEFRYLNYNLSYPQEWFAFYELGVIGVDIRKLLEQYSGKERKTLVQLYNFGRTTIENFIHYTLLRNTRIEFIQSKYPIPIIVRNVKKSLNKSYVNRAIIHQCVKCSSKNRFNTRCYAGSSIVLSGVSLEDYIYTSLWMYDFLKNKWVEVFSSKLLKPETSFSEEVFVNNYIDSFPTKSGVILKDSYSIELVGWNNIKFKAIENLNVKDRHYLTMSVVLNKLVNVEPLLGEVVYMNNLHKKYKAGKEPYLEKTALTLNFT